MCKNVKSVCKYDGEAMNGSGYESLPSGIVKFSSAITGASDSSAGFGRPREVLSVPGAAM